MEIEIKKIENGYLLEYFDENENLLKEPELLEDEARCPNWNGDQEICNCDECLVESNNV